MASNTPSKKPKSAGKKTPGMADIEKMSDDSDEDEDSKESHLLPSYQIMLSLLSLISQTEATSTLTQTASMLQKMADLVK